MSTEHGGHDCLALVEWYFGDINYVTDRWIQQKITKNDGWLSTAEFLTHDHMASLQMTVEQLFDACKSSEVVSFSDDGSLIQRRSPTPTLTPFVDVNTVHVTGIPVDRDPMLQDLRATVRPARVVVRRTKEGEWRGSAWVEFDTASRAADAAAAGLTCCGEPLTVTPKPAYMLAQMAKRGDAAGRAILGDEPVEEMDYISGTILDVSNIGNDPECTREVLAIEFAKFGKISFISYGRGNPSAEIRYADVDIANKVAELTNGKLELGGQIVSARVLPPDEEARYFVSILERSRTKKARGKR